MARFTIIFICVMTVIWASSVEYLVRNHGLAYTIACEFFDANTGIESDCGTMECTEEIVRNNQCIICTEELVTAPGQSCHDETVDTNTPTSQQTPDAGTGMDEPPPRPQGRCNGNPDAYSTVTDRDGNTIPLPIQCKTHPTPKTNHNCVYLSPNEIFSDLWEYRWGCCPSGWSYVPNPLTCSRGGMS